MEAQKIWMVRHWDSKDNQFVTMFYFTSEQKCIEHLKTWFDIYSSNSDIDMVKLDLEHNELWWRDIIKNVFHCKRYKSDYIW